jgi:hypothetical protein
VPDPRFDSLYGCPFDHFQTLSAFFLPISSSPHTRMNYQHAWHLQNRTTLRNLRRTVASADRSARQLICLTEFTRTSCFEELKTETNRFNSDTCLKLLLVSRRKDSFKLFLLHTVYVSYYTAVIFNFCVFMPFSLMFWIPFLQKSWTSLRRIIRTQVTWPLPVIWFTSWGAESVIVATNTKWSQ